MKEIFLILALIGAILLGMTLFEGQKSDNTEKETVHAHIGWAMGTGIYLVVVHSIVITYFMGTGFAVKEAVEEFNLDSEYLSRARTLKMRAFPITTLAIVSVVLAIVFGTAAFTGAAGTSAHKTIAYTAIFLNLATFYLQFSAVFQNGRLMEEITSALPEDAEGKRL